MDAELIRQIVRDELAAAGDPPAPSYSPVGAGLLLDAAGNVAYRFDGGFEVGTQTGADPADPLRSVHWTRGSDGALVAEIVAFDSGQWNLYVYGVAGSPDTEWILGAQRGPDQFTPGAYRALLAGTASDGSVGLGLPGTARIGVQCDVFPGAGGVGPGAAATILDSDGESSFVQLPSAQRAVELWGIVQTTGAIIDAGSGGWTVTKGAAGNYTVNFTAPFSSPPAVTYSAITGGARFQAMGQPTVNNVGIAVLNSAGAGFDTAFCFRAIGRA